MLEMDLVQSMPVKNTIHNLKFGSQIEHKQVGSTF